MTPSKPLQAMVILLAVALPTAYLAFRQAGLRVDAENRALKSTGTPEARALDRLVRGFGHDHTMLLAFSTVPADRGDFTAEEVREIEAVRALVGAVPGIRSVATHTQRGLRVLAARADGEHYAEPVRAAVEAAQRACPAAARLHVTGAPAFETMIAEATSREQRIMVPSIAATLFGLLLLCYRSAGLALVILLPAGAGIAWTGGAFALFGHDLDPIAVLLQPVILTVGVAGGVHLVEAYLLQRRRGAAADVAASRAARGLVIPALLTTGTTVCGFLALTVNPIPAVADFGIYAAFGAAAACGLAFWLVPSLLVLLARVRPRAGLHARCATSGSLAQALIAWVKQRSRAVIAVAAALAAVSAWQWRDMQVDTDPMRVLPADHRLRRDTETVTSRLGGVDSFGLLVPAGSVAAEPDRLALLIADIVDRPGVVGPAGPVQRAASGDLLFEALLEPGGSGPRERLFDAIDERARVLGFDGVQVAGTSVQVARDSSRLVRGQLVGMTLTLGCLFVTMTAAFRSPMLGLLGVIPNLLPCLWLYGALSAWGRPLSVATAMIGSVMLGLVVDDTIHFLYRFRAARARGTACTRSLARAFADAGRPIVVTSLVLAVGFATGVLGSLETTREFGALASATILAALAADLVLLPALLLVLDRPGRGVELDVQRTV